MSSTSTVARSARGDVDSLPLPRDVQWGLINSKLDALSLSVSLLAVPDWFDLVDKAVLLTLLAKFRSELDLLHSEIEPPESLRRTSSGIKFPDYDVGICGSKCTPPSQPSSLPTQALGSRLMTRRARNIDDGIGEALAKINTKGRHGGGQEDGRFSRSEKLFRLSPLSPTFGPRKGLVPSGTVERRRSIPVNTPMPEANPPTNLTHRDTPPCPAALANSKRTPCVLGRNGYLEKRILWEAAWTEIEQNLDVYIDRFEKAACGGTEQEKTDIWTELVRSQGEKRALVDT